MNKIHLNVRGVGAAPLAAAPLDALLARLRALLSAGLAALRGRRGQSVAMLRHTRWLGEGGMVVVARRDARGRRITCEEGQVWLTQGDGQDHVLRAGDSLELVPRDDVVVRALRGPARVREECTGLR